MHTLKNKNFIETNIYNYSAENLKNLLLKYTNSYYTDWSIIE